MGVKGLQGWLKANTQLLGESLYFSNSKLIVDGNNLFCCIFVKICTSSKENFRNDVYGGDMVLFAKVVSHFFDNLRRCNLEPIIVFDGSVIGKQSTSNEVALKTATVYKRGLDKFNIVGMIDESIDNSNDIIIPITIREIFISLALAYKVTIVQTPYDADSRIAYLANLHSCPVLTNDSDFIIYGLKVGFIMLDFFDFQQIYEKQNSFCIHGVMFSQTKLLTIFNGLSSECMPLLSVFLGNDYVDADVCKDVLDRLNPRFVYGPLVTKSYNQRKIVTILQWLSQQTFREALQKIRINSSDTFYRSIEMLLNNYNVSNPDDLKQELLQVYKDDSDSSMGELAACYLTDRLQAGQMSTISLDIIFGNICYNYPIIDDWTQASSSEVKYRPISVALSLLKKGKSDKIAPFVIYDRVNGRYDKVLIKPCLALKNFGPLEDVNIYKVAKLEKEQRRIIFFDIFELDKALMVEFLDELTTVFSASMADQVCFVISLLNKVQPEPYFIYAVLYCIFYHASLRGHINGSNIDSNQTEPFIANLESHTFKGNGQEYPMTSTLYRKIVHRIAQMHCLFESYRLVNGLLDNIVPRLRPELFFNSTLIARLASMLCSGHISNQTLSQQVPALGFLCERMNDFLK